VYGQIHPAVQKRFFDLFNKKPLAADFGKGHIRYFVSFGFDDNQVRTKGRVSGRERAFDPTGLPKGKGAAPCSDPDGRVHYTPQVAQLVAVHPLQAEPDAEVLTVSPPFPLLTKPQADMSLLTFLE
jgi:hypothetical protein